MSFIKSANGIMWRWHIVKAGDDYGLNNCLINDGPPQVEFYDVKPFDGEQLVSRYYLSTILDIDAGLGLNLHGGVPAWQIDGETMDIIKNQLKEAIQS